MPLILVSLQQKRELTGVNLSGDSLVLRTVDKDGADSKTGLMLNSDGVIEINASKSLSASGVLSLKSGKLTVTGDTRIGGKLEVT
jgi:hypothetical protein